MSSICISRGDAFSLFERKWLQTANVAEGQRTRADRKHYTTRGKGVLKKAALSLTGLSFTGGETRGEIHAAVTERVSGSFGLVGSFLLYFLIRWAISSLVDMIIDKYVFRYVPAYIAAEPRPLVQVTECHD